MSRGTELYLEAKQAYFGAAKAAAALALLGQNL